ncbi:hypothetical protein CDAR_283711 [Caerostris darwini]|uniref:C2H2-type domain-containing protein n=1 Tax=Caerostris darwini TaxID=1538125 RepID=A0AAV4MBW2_9ARAC|nr:hypothetical protein CDAR_283711 [Caerostris darwini]
MNQNPQCCESFSPKFPDNVSLPVAETCVLPGFQQTFGHKNPLMNQMAHHPNASSQMECPGIFHTDETSPDFISDFNENENASTNPISQFYEASLSIPILAVQNAQYNPMDPIPQTNSIGPIDPNKCPSEFLPQDHLEPQDRSRSVARPHACNYCDRTFSCSWSLTRHLHTPTDEKSYACTVCNKCPLIPLANWCNKRVRKASMRYLNTHTGEKPYACKSRNLELRSPWKMGCNNVTNYISLHNIVEG